MKGKFKNDWPFMDAIMQYLADSRNNKRKKQNSGPTRGHDARDEEQGMYSFIVDLGLMY